MDDKLYKDISARITSLYGLTAEGRWQDVEAMLTDDFRIIEAESLPYGGTWEGKDALQRLYQHVFGFWENAVLDLEDMTISENHVVCLLTIHATSRHTGQQLAMKVAEVFHLRGDKICGITPYYFDTVEIARATGTALNQD